MIKNVPAFDIIGDIATTLIDRDVVFRNNQFLAHCLRADLLKNSKTICMKLLLLELTEIWVHEFSVGLITAATQEKMGDILLMTYFWKQELSSGMMWRE